MHDDLVVAAAQLRATGDPAANLALAVESIARAADRGARLVVLPEATLACFGSPLRDLAQLNIRVAGVHR